MKPAELKYNERSWAIDLISHINQIIPDAGLINRAGGEFSTPQNVAELLVRLTLWNKESNARRCTCISSV